MQPFQNNAWGDFMDQEHLCLTDLLDQDLTAYEFYQTLPQNVRNLLKEQEITSFDELQDAADRLKSSNPEVI